MSLPVPDPTVSSAAVYGTPVDDALFPRDLSRRILVPQEPGETSSFFKRGAELLDYAVDLSRHLNADEYILGCYGWTSAPADLVVNEVRFGTKGAFLSVFGGLDGTAYTLSLMIKTTAHRSFEIRATLDVTESAGDAMSTYRPPTIGTVSDPAQSYLQDAAGNFLAPSYLDAAGVSLF